jgi:hypothetical protein
LAVFVPEVTTMAKLSRNKRSGVLSLYVPKREEDRLGLDDGDEVEVHLYLIRKATEPKRKKEV